MAHPFSAAYAGSPRDRSWGSFQTSRRLRRGRRKRAYRPFEDGKVVFEPLEPRLLLSADLGVIDRFDFQEYFDNVQIELDAAVFSAPIPLAGAQLAQRQSGEIATKISQEFEDFAQGLVEDLDVRFVPLGSMQEFRRNHFSDLMHVNRAGREELTRAADDALREVLASR